jgi:hypothetical protein
MLFLLFYNQAEVFQVQTVCTTDSQLGIANTLLLFQCLFFRKETK